MPDISTCSTNLNNVDKYISKFYTKVGESKTGNSRYYQIEDKVIRVSNHIGKNSDGLFQIIVKPNGYIIYHPGTGTVNICSYRQVQEFIRTFALFPVDDRVKQEIVLSKDSDQMVLGVPITAMTPGQISSINSIVQKIKNTKTIC